MIIALFSNPHKLVSKKVQEELKNLLLKRGVTVVAPDDEATTLSVEPMSRYQQNQIDFVISIGGDGTILRLVHSHPELSAPIIGVNIGSLGFLADIPLREMEHSIDSILKGEYVTEKRCILEANLNNKNSFAVNEYVIHRSSNPSLIDLAVTVDGKYLNTFSADGIIISTPSGSTAYSLSAGGPILTPDLEAIVITPINPHTISNKPIVLMPKKDITVQYLNDDHFAEVVTDGIVEGKLSSHEKLTIYPSKRLFKLITLKDHDYFSTLRGKLGWTGTLKNSDF